MKLEIKKKLVVRSERVKSVQLHPTLPWVVGALYSGNVTIHDYQKQSNVKTFEVSSEPVRAVAFNPRNFWIITAADDHFVSVFNYNIMEKLKSFEAHLHLHQQDTAPSPNLIPGSSRYLLPGYDTTALNHLH